LFSHSVTANESTDNSVSVGEVGDFTSSALNKHTEQTYSAEAPNSVNISDDDDKFRMIGGYEAKNKSGDRKHGGSKNCTEESEEVSEYEDTAKEKAESRKSRRKSMNDKKGVGKKICLDEIALKQKRHFGAENKEMYGNMFTEGESSVFDFKEQHQGQTTTPQRRHPRIPRKDDSSRGEKQVKEAFVTEKQGPDGQTSGKLKFEPV